MDRKTNSKVSPKIHRECCGVSDMMVQQLGTLAAFLKDLGSILTSYMSAHYFLVYKASTRESDVLL